MTHHLRAGDVYECGVEPHEKRGWRRFTIGVWMAVSTLAMGSLGEPSIGELVVRGRSDGREVLRTDAQDAESAGQLVAHVRRQLDELTPEDFRDAWGIEDPAVTKG